jgi:hypothetical protein
MRITTSEGMETHAAGASNGFSMPIFRAGFVGFVSEMRSRGGYCPLAELLAASGSRRPCLRSAKLCGRLSTSTSTEV